VFGPTSALVVRAGEFGRAKATAVSIFRVDCSAGGRLGSAAQRLGPCWRKAIWCVPAAKPHHTPFFSEADTAWFAAGAWKRSWEASGEGALRPGLSFSPCRARRAQSSWRACFGVAEVAQELNERQAVERTSPLGSNPFPSRQLRTKPCRPPDEGRGRFRRQGHTDQLPSAGPSLAQRSKSSAGRYSQPEEMIRLSLCCEPNRQGERQR